MSNTVIILGATALAVGGGVGAAYLATRPSAPERQAPPAPAPSTAPTRTATPAAIAPPPIQPVAAQPMIYMPPRQQSDVTAWLQFGGALASALPGILQGANQIAETFSPPPPETSDPAVASYVDSVDNTFDQATADAFSAFD